MYPNYQPQSQQLSLPDYIRSVLQGQQMTGLKAHYQQFAANNSAEHQRLAQIAQAVSNASGTQLAQAVMEAIVMCSSAFALQRGLVPPDKVATINHNIQRLQMISNQDRRQMNVLAAPMPQQQPIHDTYSGLMVASSTNNQTGSVGIIRGPGDPQPAMSMSQSMPEPMINVSVSKPVTVPQASNIPEPTDSTKISFERLAAWGFIEYHQHLLDLGKRMKRDLHDIINGARRTSYLTPAKPTVAARAATAVIATTEPTSAKFALSTDQEYTPTVQSPPEDVITDLLSKIVPGSTLISGALRTVLAPATKMGGIDALLAGIRKGNLNTLPMSMSLLIDQAQDARDYAALNVLRIINETITTAINAAINEGCRDITNIDVFMTDWNELLESMDTFGVTVEDFERYVCKLINSSCTDLHNEPIYVEKKETDEYVGESVIVTEAWGCMVLPKQCSDFGLDALTDGATLILAKTYSPSLIKALKAVMAEYDTNRVMLGLMDATFTVYVSCVDPQTLYIRRLT